MQIPGGGPKLNIRGFFDFNFGAGSIANPLIFPIASNGCETCGNPQTPPHSAFQAGEFDLFITSKLSRTSELYCRDSFWCRIPLIDSPSTLNDISLLIDTMIIFLSAPDAFTRLSAITTRPTITAIGSRPRKDDLSCTSLRTAAVSCPFTPLE